MTTTTDPDLKTIEGQILCVQDALSDGGLERLSNTQLFNVAVMFRDEVAPAIELAALTIKQQYRSADALAHAIARELDRRGESME